MPTKENLLVGRILVEENIITSEQLEAGLKEQKRTGDFICTTLVKLGFAPQEKVFSVLSRQLNIPYVKLKDKEIPQNVIEKVSAKFASHYKIVPIEYRDNTLVIAMANPLDTRTLDDINLLLGIEVKAVLSSEVEINEELRKYYGVGADTLEQIMAQKEFSGEIQMQAEKTEDIETLAEDASIIKFVNQILSEAVKDRATDIHIEPFQDELRVRFRIDGVLYKINIPGTIRYFHPAIISRIKVMAQMNIAEHRMPQDGRIKIKVAERELDLRISTLPTAFGEGVHMRILSSHSFLELEKLGLAQCDLAIIENVIKKPHGIIFVTGPTGSGKSTTLYASLAKINSMETKIITIEDPIEYQLKGINQMQVIPKIGFDFAIGLRHILRHDPDVIMVGEVRDYETAEIAIRSALTGHLVFSTLHTNDAAGAITRLVDMGVEPFLVSSSLECLIAQRLVRLICPKCKTAISGHKKADILKQAHEEKIETSEIELFEGKGCQECRFTGYRGRTGIYEILRISEPIREMIVTKSTSQQIKQKAIAEGMRTLRRDGLCKVLRGLTTLSEVMRVSQQETT
ncbi:MAG: GspE/PulE family protein [Candidatus Omnitrophica bacterium]|nr:GspE/PulE family protein [Candidatus Omnitrophota bacterium]